MLYRTCDVCEDILPETYFSVREDTKKHRHDCNECRNEREKLRYRDDSLSRAKSLLNGYKNTDKRKGFVCDLDAEHIVKYIFSHDCIYCDEYDNIGCDRVDNNKGHTKENCVPCCRDCNTTRSNIYTFDEMMIIGAVKKALRQAQKCGVSASRLTAQLVMKDF